MLAGVCLAQSNDSTSGLETKLLALERLWNESQVTRDANALSSMIADRFVNTEWDGEVSSRGKFLEEIADPQFKADLLNIEDVKVNV